MTPELEKLIDSAIINGTISDRSKELLIKKAEQLGIAALDFELYLESKLGQSKNMSIAGTTESHSYTQAPPITTNKEGVVKKCPSCGAPTESFNTKCQECGHEFRDIQAAKSVKELSNQLENAAQKIRKERENLEVTKENRFLRDPNKVAREIAISQASIISSFPVPNTKEDILEFLSIALPEAKKKPNDIGDPRIVLDGSDVLKNTWLAKCEQVIMKAKFSMKDDKKSMEEIEYYANQLAIHQQQNNKGCLGLILNPFIKIIQGGK
jgi:hypothetical protein